MKKGIIVGVALLSTLSMAALGAFSSNGVPAAHATQVHHTAKQAAAHTLKLQHIYLTILPASHLGPDKIMHDSFSPADFSVVQGVPVQVSVYNYDGGSHSFTSSALKLNVMIKGSPKTGVPSVTTFKFTPTKTGEFTWECVVQCDGQANGWAMSHDGYMMGKVNVVPNHNEQFVTLTIKDGLKFGPTKKTKHGTSNLHDSYSPADFTVTAGVPVHLTVVNWDTGNHSLTAPEIGVNKVFPGAAKEGVPSVTNFTFTVPKSGKYKWQCEIKCDGGMQSYAMTHDGYMLGYITAVN